MYYPIMLDLKNKDVLIVGAGKVAYRKIKNLIKAEANITVVSKEFLDEFKKLNIELIEDDYNKDYIADKFLVIAATSNKKINEQIARDAKDKNILCNVVDNKDLSDFITPAISNNEEILISICTNGKYPALSKYIRKDLDNRYDKYTKEYLYLLEKFRMEVLKNKDDNKEELIKKVLDMDIDELEMFVFEYINK